MWEYYPVLQDCGANFVATAFEEKPLPNYRLVIEKSLISKASSLIHL
jgi:hypothetical protein